MNIKQIDIKNFRSINEDGIEIVNLQKNNLFIGENNSGKSNILKIIPFISNIFSSLPKLSGNFSLSVHNSHSQPDDLFFDKGKAIYLSIVFSFNDKEKEYFVSGIPTDSGSHSIFKAELFNNQNNTITLSFDITLGEENSLNYNLISLFWGEMSLINKSDQIIRDCNGQLSSQNNFYEQYGASMVNSNFNYLNVILSKLKNMNVNFRIIKAVRKIGGTSNIDDGNTYGRLVNLLDIGGDRVIDNIFEWQAPNNSYDVLLGKYEKLNSFISSLVDAKVKLIVTSDKTKVLIKVEKNNEKTLTYKSWGSSLEELIVLIVDILSSPDYSFLALEEPEIHLDPFMQRKLVSFLRENTNHQYLISSHSSVLINSFTDELSGIFRVYKENGATKVNRADDEVLENILDDLGVKASDILQTNGIIWVEGPSDRIFINKWISLIDKKLIEGIDYSIMFYGGRLLSHLCIDGNDADSEVNNFIKLLKLNRNMAIIIDSDKRKEDDQINQTKQRIRDEISKNSDRAMVWITDGKEIENYIPSRFFIEKLGIEGMDKFTCVSELKKNYLKVDSANILVDYMADEIIKENIELKEKMDALLKRINSWNV